LPDIVRSTVIEQGKTVVLIGLSGYERMIVHQLFSDIKGLSTNSVGADNARKLLIMPTSEFGSTGMDEAIVWDIAKN
jgi:predicted RNA-binding protein Jag